MAQKSDWTVSADQLKALKEATQQLRKVVTRGDTAKIEPHIKKVRTALVDVLGSMSPTEKPSRARIAIRQQWFVSAPGEIDKQLAEIERANRSKSPDRTLILVNTATAAGNEVFSIISRSLAHPGVQQFLP